MASLNSALTIYMIRPDESVIGLQPLYGVLVSWFSHLAGVDGYLRSAKDRVLQDHVANIMGNDSDALPSPPDNSFGLGVHLASIVQVSLR